MKNFIKTIVPIEEYSEVTQIGDNYIVHLDPQEISETEYICYECTVDKEPNIEELTEELNQHKQRVYAFDLNAVKQNKTKELSEYDSSDAVNSFSVNGVSMWVPADKRAVLRTSIEAYKALGAESITKVWEGQEYTFPVADWDSMLNQVEVYASECFNQTQRHLAAINALDTIEAVNEYDFTQGYPEKLAF